MAESNEGQKYSPFLRKVKAECLRFPAFFLFFLIDFLKFPDFLTKTERTI